MKKTCRIALLGAGTVGSQTARLLVQERELLEKRTGISMEIAGIACLHPHKVKASWIDSTLLTTDAIGLCTRNDVDVVVELIGGIEPAYQFVRSALEHGKSVVSANKALLAEYGPQLYACAQDHGVDLYFEAAVGGAIPILRPLRESLLGDQITRVFGIVNGTTNYILDEMTERHLDFDIALRQAQEQGYAEADPTGDVEGYDAANKAAILASLAFHMPVSIDDVEVEGITSITASDIAAAANEKRVIKLLAALEYSDGAVSARVYPALLDQTHPLASVHGSFNAVFVHAREAGDLMFYGRGAGGAPTASAVVGDIVSAARNIARSTSAPSISLYKEHHIASGEAIRGDFVVRCSLEEAGLALVDEVMSVFHELQLDAKYLPLVCDVDSDGDCPYCGVEGAGDMRVYVKDASESVLRRCIAEISALDVVVAAPLVLRVVNND